MIKLKNIYRNGKVVDGQVREMGDLIMGIDLIKQNHHQT